MFPRTQPFWQFRVESWAWSPVLALPKHHVPQEQDCLGVGDEVLLSSPCSHSPHPILPLQLDSQGFWAWGVEGGADQSCLNSSGTLQPAS